MTERSYYWDGLVTGDAVLAPYSADIWNMIWQILFSRNDNEGVIRGIDDELVVAGVIGGVSVATGVALVDGALYQNLSSVVNVVMASPTTNPRIDRIVIQKDWSLKTIRIARLEGTEAASPTAPTLTQTAGSVWEIPLAQVLITTAGVITVTNEREFSVTRLSSDKDFIEIETIELTGSETEFDFQNIPFVPGEGFRQLVLIGSILTNSATGVVEISLNGVGVAIDYNREVIAKTGGSPVAIGVASQIPPIDSMGSGASSNLYNTQFEIKIPVQVFGSLLFNSFIQSETTMPDNTVGNFDMSQEGATFLTNSAIFRVMLRAQSGGVFLSGSKVTLYGQGRN